MYFLKWGFPGGSEVKVPASNSGDPGLIPGSGSPLEKEMVTHSSILFKVTFILFSVEMRI